MLATSSTMDDETETILGLFFEIFTFPLGALFTGKMAGADEAKRNAVYRNCSSVFLCSM